MQQQRLRRLRVQLTAVTGAATERAGLARQMLLVALVLPSLVVLRQQVALPGCAVSLPLPLQRGCDV